MPCMYWMDSVEKKHYTVSFSLRDLRTSKSIKIDQLADVLKISKSMYHAIENGTRKPNIDIAYKLAVIYETSMDFIYHAFYRQYYVWHFPDGELKQAMREAMATDVQYLRDRLEPAKPPELPKTIIWEKDMKPAIPFYPYGLELVDQK